MVGKEFITTEGYKAIILEYDGFYKSKILLSDGTILKNIALDKLRKGNIKNPYHITAFGVGFFGVGNYKSSCNKKTTKNYLTWKTMMQRCYDKKYQEKQPSYIDCNILKEWHNFQNFAKWFEDNYTEDFCLDKDILIKGNKIYSSETCCFVPQEINALFTKCDSVRGDYPIGVRLRKSSRYQARLSKNGRRVNLGTFDTPEEAFQAYKTAKELYIKEVADKWKDQITEQTYKAMYNYVVEITD